MVLCTAIIIILWKQVFSPGAKVFSTISGNIKETTASLERQGDAHDERMRRMDEQLASMRKSSQPGCRSRPALPWKIICS